MLKPGESQKIDLAFDARALAFYDVARKAWVAERGAFALHVGFSSEDIAASAPFSLLEDWIDDSPARALANA